MWLRIDRAASASNVIQTIVSLSVEYNQKQMTKRASRGTRMKTIAQEPSRCAVQRGREAGLTFAITARDVLFRRRESPRDVYAVA